MNIRLLPEPSLFESVYPDEPVTRRGLLYRVSCAHTHTTGYVRIDHRTGPGSFADNYEGTACCTCGAILEERQTL